MLSSRIAMLGVLGLLAGSPLLALDQTARLSLFYSIPGDIEFNGANDATLDGEAGIGVGLAWGVNLPVLRAEVEALWIDYGFDGIDSANLNHASGDFRRVGIFGNAIFDLPGIPFVDPYVGVGVGMVSTDFDVLVRRVSDTGTVSLEESLDDGKISPALQFMVGGKVELADKLYATLGYRLMYIEQDVQVQTRTVSANNLTHNVEASVGFNF